MKLEQQVTSLEISKRLKELEVNQESLFYWRLGYSTLESFKDGVSTGRKGHFRDMELTYYPHPRYMTADVKWNQADLAKVDESELSALTVAELGEMLPDYLPDDKTGVRSFFQFTFDKGGRKYDVAYVYHSDDGLMTDFSVRGDTEADARGKMLIYLLENKLITL